MNNTPFGSETANAPWNQPDAGSLPRCAYCGRPAEREYPDQSEDDIALAYADAEHNDFCSRNCAIEYCLTVRQRRLSAGTALGTAELRRELTEMYRAASILADLDDEVLEAVESSDDGQGMLAVAGQSGEERFRERSRFLDLPSVRDVAYELCKLLGGEDREPDWMCGDREWQRAEEWLEALVRFRARRYAHEAWPRAMDLSRAQIAALYGFYAAQRTAGAEPGAQNRSGGEARAAQ
jgi:hypothetical protein